MSCVKFINRFTNNIIQNSFLRSGSYVIVRNKSMKLDPDWVPKDPETHTGQHWSKDDYRLARFIDRPKHINENFAIDLIEKSKPIASEQRVICCDGGDDHVGHPRVYINLDKPGNHSCGYCGLRYYLNEKKH